AKYVEFTTLYDSKQMPGVRMPVLRWPYVEGLRMDEATHPLTILVVGLYDEVLPNQNGAPLRLAVPWKYGFKHAKSIVKIRFVEKQPMNTWQLQTPNEYGFYSNVDPTVDHLRRSLANDRRLSAPLSVHYARDHPISPPDRLERHCALPPNGRPVRLLLRQCPSADLHRVRSVSRRRSVGRDPRVEDVSQRGRVDRPGHLQA